MKQTIKNQNPSAPQRLAGKNNNNKPLTLRGWVFDDNGKPIEKLLHESFTHFYLTSFNHNGTQENSQEKVQ
jgi:hypothetical protein